MFNLTRTPLHKSKGHKRLYSKRVLSLSSEHETSKSLKNTTSLFILSHFKFKSTLLEPTFAEMQQIRPTRRLYLDQPNPARPGLHTPAFTTLSLRISREGPSGSNVDSYQYFCVSIPQIDPIRFPVQLLGKGYFLCLPSNFSCL